MKNFGVIDLGIFDYNLVFVVFMIIRVNFKFKYIINKVYKLFNIK